LPEPAPLPSAGADEAQAQPPTDVSLLVAALGDALERELLLAVRLRARRPL